jgi:phospholipid/cholesterol/gamma-HCH transport system permease protein
MYIANILINTGKIFYGIIDTLNLFLRHVAYISDLTWKTFSRTHLLVRNINLTLHQMFIIGVESLPLVIVTSIFVGGETVVQANFLFAGLVPLRYLGYAVSKSLITELCPVLTCFVVSSRIATAIAAEIGSMKTSEQLDAMTCLSLDSIRYLIVPKVVACVVMMPVLVIFSELVAFTGSVITAILFVDVTMYQYCSGLKLFFSVPHMMVGITKTTIFGAIIAFTGSHFGFQSTKGAKGVGEATTRAVMSSMVLILFFDFLIAFLTLRSI